MGSGRKGLVKASGVNDREQIDAVLLDFSKAFDKVPHQHLSMKLDHYGIQGRSLGVAGGGGGSGPPEFPGFGKIPRENGRQAKILYSRR